jgi:hypothetical protein
VPVYEGFVLHLEGYWGKVGVGAIMRVRCVFQAVNPFLESSQAVLCSKGRVQCASHCLELFSSLSCKAELKSAATGSAARSNSKHCMIMTLALTTK